MGRDGRAESWLSQDVALSVKTIVSSGAPPVVDLCLAVAASVAIAIPPASPLPRPGVVAAAIPVAAGRPTRLERPERGPIHGVPMYGRVDLSVAVGAPRRASRRDGLGLELHWRPDLLGESPEPSVLQHPDRARSLPHDPGDASDVEAPSTRSRITSP
jgi:hypothetical protein